MKRKTDKSQAARTKSALTASYNRYKRYEGRQYTGMAIGRTHHWYYDKADWKEKKITPDKWEFAYSTVKRRAGHAPEGSGVPVGTGYHWFILAHQYVEKLNANDYTTQMVGLKFKLAHKRANKENWSASGEKQRKQLIQLLKSFIAELEKEPEQVVPVPLAFTYRDTEYDGMAVPVPAACENGVCCELDITLNDKHLGIIRNTEKGWKLGTATKGLTHAIGEQIKQWYQR